MKAFFKKWAGSFAAWMKDRTGVDQLAIASLFASLLFQFIASASGVWVFLPISLGLYAWTLFRVFSKRSYKRYEENRKFIAFWTDAKTKTKQFFLRLKLRKQFKYFRCPKCRVLMRTARGGGEKEMHCPRCQTAFKVKS